MDVFRLNRSKGSTNKLACSAIIVELGVFGKCYANKSYKKIKTSQNPLELKTIEYIRG